MMEYNIDYFSSSDVLFQISKLSEKPLMYIRADGPNQCQNPEILNQVWDFYDDKCDVNIIAGLKQFGEIYCYFLTKEQAWNAFNEWFPQKSDLSDEEKDFYFYVRLVSVNDDIDIVNGV